MERKVLLSSDIAGLRSQPDRIKGLYQEALPLLGQVNQGFNLEVIALKPTYKDFISQSARLGYRIVGWHGPIGALRKNDSFYEQVQKGVFNTALVNLAELIALGQQTGEYILIHEPELDRPGNQLLLSQSQDKIACLLIENVCKKGSLQKTVQTVNQLDRQGFKAGVMVDLLHFLTEFSWYSPTLSTGQLNLYWPQMLDQVKQLVSGTAIAGIHLPVGTDSDSLPVKAMTDHHWGQLAVMLNQCPQIKFLVLENQLYLGNKLGISQGSKSDQEISKRNFHLVETLIKTGVIPS